MTLDNTIQTLVHLGLSLNQAKVYRAVGCRQFSSVLEIQNKADVPRAKIYGTLEKLSDKGLIERSITKPKKYRAIRMAAAVSFLLQEKTNEITKIKKMAQQLVDQSRIENILITNNPNFILIPKKYGTIKRRKEEIKNSKRQIDFLVSWERFPRTVETFADSAKIALDNGVKIRVILERPNAGHRIPKIVYELMKYPKYQIKIVSYEPSAILGIFDRKKVIIDTSTNTELAQQPSLLTNNPSLVSIIIDYFERIWEEIPRCKNSILNHSKK